MKRVVVHLEKFWDSLSKKQVAGVGALLIVPGGIPILLWHLYKKYKPLLSEIEIVIHPKKGPSDDNSD